MLAFLFWVAILTILYVYLGYPLALLVLSKLRPDPPQRSNLIPKVTILIAAYNEESVIEETVRNKLLLDYPQESLEIIVIVDGCEDGTEDIVKSIQAPNLRLLRQIPRAGKTSALNMGIAEASGEIIVFSDANSLYEPKALRQLVANFADPKVGYVTGKMVYQSEAGSLVGDGCSGYMKYENMLRNLETSVGSVVGVDGGIDAVRKSLYRPMQPDQLPDFVLPLTVIDQGYRVVYEPHAVLCEASLHEDTDEYRMRVRVSLRAYWALWDMRHLLLFRRNSLFSWQLWSHKVLRYLCFVFLFVAFLVNLVIVGQGFIYILFLLLQLCCYGFALGAPWLERRGYGTSFSHFCRYFLLLNLASAHAFGKFICGKKQILWTPRKG